MRILPMNEFETFVYTLHSTLFVCTALSINALGGVDKLCICLH